MLRVILAVLSIGLVVVAVTIGVGGILLTYKLAGGQVIDCGHVGDWWFVLRSWGLEVSYDNRILFTVNPFIATWAMAIPPAFYLVFENARRRRERRRGFVMDDDPSRLAQK